MIGESSLCNLGDQGNVNVIKDFGVIYPLFQQCVLLAEYSIATTLIPGKLPPWTVSPIALWEIFAQFHNQCIIFFQYSWQVFVHDNSFLSKKVWVVFIIYRAQLHVASCICVLIRPLDATVHCGHFFNVFAMECILDKTYHVHLYS